MEMKNLRCIQVIIFFVLIFYENSIVLGGGSGLPTKQHIAALHKHLQVHLCSENDPKFGECMRNLLQHLIKHASTGFKGSTVPIMDPLHVTKVTFNLNNGLIQGTAIAENVSIRGLKDAKIQSMQAKLVNKVLQTIIYASLPKVHITGNIQVDVRLNNGKIASRSPFELILSDLNVKITEISDFYERDGHKYLRAKQVDLEYDLGDMQLKADRIVQDPALNNIFMDFVNTGWRNFYKPLVQETLPQLKGMFTQIANYYWSHIPYTLVNVK